MSPNSDLDGPLDLEMAYRQALEAVGGHVNDIGSWAPEVDDTNEESSPTESLVVKTSAAWAKSEVEESRVSPRQVVEAALFVGGVELTGKRLADLLKGDYGEQGVARIIDDLNRRYAAEQRPYEILYIDRAYRMSLRMEFEGLRRRVYGLGPKEVKLTSDALEVLSLIAYRQPIAREVIESLREGNAGNTLRQLVRRNLIVIEREEGESRYVTTDRFLEVFGLANLSELPRSANLEYK